MAVLMSFFKILKGKNLKITNHTLTEPASIKRKQEAIVRLYLSLLFQIFQICGLSQCWSQVFSFIQIHSASSKMKRNIPTLPKT